MKIKQYIVFLLIFLGYLNGHILINATLAFAANSNAFHGTDADILTLGYAVPNVALAESNIAQDQNPFAGFQNPAGLHDYQKASIFSTHGQLSEGTQIFSLNGVYSLSSKMVAALNWIQVQVQSIPIVSQSEYDLNTDIEPDSLTAYLSNGLIGSLSYQLLPQIAAGFALTAYQLGFTDLSYKGYGVSVSPGIQYQLNSSLALGMYIRHMFSHQWWLTGRRETLEPFVHLGLAYEMIPACNLYAKVQRGFHSTTKVAFQYGVEWQPISVLTLRLGVMPQEMIWPLMQVNTGLGITIEQFHLDYTYVGKTSFGFSESSRISVGMNF